MSLWLWGIAFAQEQMAKATGTSGAGQAGHAAGAAQGSGWMSLLMLLLFVAIFYFLLIRPQQKQRKKHEEFLSNLKRGDMVYTTAGILGKVTEIDNAGGVVVLEVAKDTRIRVLKNQVAGYYRPGQETPKQEG